MIKRNIIKDKKNNQGLLPLSSKPSSKNKEGRQRTVSLSSVLLAIFFSASLFGVSVYTSKSASSDSQQVEKVPAQSHQTLSHNEKTTAEARSERLERYKQRYTYNPPAASINHKDLSEICGTGPDFSTYFSQSFMFRSLNNEDQDIYKLFFKDNWEKGNKGYGVVEMGAYDGHQESNSRFFEHCLGWETLLIEGSPKTYEKLVTNRPNAHRMNFAPSCSEEDDIADKMIAFDNYPMTNAGLGSVKTSYSVKNWTVDVPCGSLTPVLMDVFPNGHVSFFSLDVEGSEPMVVDNIDFRRVFIEVIMIEHHNNFCKPNKCESRDKFRKIMDDNGYIRFTQAVKKSDVFIHPMSEHLQSALKVPHLKTEYEAFLKNKNGKNIIPAAANPF